MSLSHSVRRTVSQAELFVSLSTPMLIVLSLCSALKTCKDFSYAVYATKHSFSQNQRRFFFFLWRYYCMNYRIVYEHYEYVYWFIGCPLYWGVCVCLAVGAIRLTQRAANTYAMKGRRCATEMSDSKPRTKRGRAFG